MLKDFVSGFMTDAIARLEGRTFVAMSATVEEVDGILKLKDTFQKVLRLWS